MIILHTADLHLNSKLETNLDAQKAKKRRTELILTFQNIVRYARNCGARALIIAGDMFDSSRIPESLVATVLSEMEQASEVDFLLLRGNHDAADPFDRLDTLPPNVHKFGNDWTYFRYENVCIAGACKPSDETFMYHHLNFSPQEYNIAVLHGDINTEIRLPSLRGNSIDYLALGHYHSYSAGKIDERGTYAYSGCPESRGFDESGVKGICRIDTDLKTVSFVTGLSVRTLYEITVDITGLSSSAQIRDAMNRQIDDAGVLPQDMVKVILEGTYAQTVSKDVELLLADLTSRFYFAKIKDRSALQISAEDYRHDVSVKGEFVRSVLTSDLSQEEKDAVLLLGIRAMERGEVSL